MKLQNLKGLNEDLNRGIEYNRKHGGVSDKLKRIMKRPESKNWRLHAFNDYNREAYEEGWEFAFGKKKKK